MITWIALIVCGLGLVLFTWLETDACRLRVEAVVRDDRNTPSDVYLAHVMERSCVFARYLCIIGAVGAVIALWMAR